jgi:hypothetical protein
MEIDAIPRDVEEMLAYTATNNSGRLFAMQFLEGNEHRSYEGIFSLRFDADSAMVSFLYNLCSEGIDWDRVGVEERARYLRQNVIRPQRGAHAYVHKYRRNSSDEDHDDEDHDIAHQGVAFIGGSPRCCDGINVVFIQ